MQIQSDNNIKGDEIKTQFRTREGYYKLMTSPDYSQRSQRAIGFSSTGTSSSGTSSSGTSCSEKTCIKISLVRINNTKNSVNAKRRLGDKKICFNVGRDLFVYNYEGVRRGPDASKPIYKRAYKGSLPTCHDFNQTTATSESIPLLIGFSHGQIQLIDLLRKNEQEIVKEFNVDRLIDKTKVTCIKWIPDSSNLFLVSHVSGQLYLYKDDLPCGATAPCYQQHKQNEGATIYTCKTKTTRNPIHRWSLGNNNSSNSSSSNLQSTNVNSSLNEFSFSPCAKYLACVSQDGFLRVFCYDTMDSIGRVRSYYGGLSCVCWSPDGKYVVTGGEDDLITVWSFLEKRVVARGQGHKSWVSVVAFDPYYTGYDDVSDDNDDDDDDEDEDDTDDIIHDLNDSDNEDQGNIQQDDRHFRHSTMTRRSRTAIEQKSPSHTIISSDRRSLPTMTSYRFGSVGQDTHLCFWDLNDDIITQPVAKSRTSVLINSNNSAPQNSTMLNKSNFLPNSSTHISTFNQMNSRQINELCPTNSSGTLYQSHHHQQSNQVAINKTSNQSSSMLSNSIVKTNSELAHSQQNHGIYSSKSFTLGKKDKRSFSLTSRNSDKSTMNRSNHAKSLDDPVRLLGSPVCPYIDDVPVLEPTVCKRISYERLTSLIFCQDGFITSCQEGVVFSWARPMRVSDGKLLFVIKSTTKLIEYVTNQFLFCFLSNTGQ